MQFKRTRSKLSSMRTRYAVVAGVTLACCFTVAFSAAAGTADAALSGSVQIGVEGAMTGTYASVGTGLWQGANAAAAEINAQGGLMGQKIVLDQGDDVDDPGDAVPVITKLVNVDHIAGLVGPASITLPV